MPLSLKPLHPLFAAEAGGVDLGKPLSPGEVRDIEAAMDRYAVLVFRDRLPEHATQRVSSIGIPGALVTW